MPGPNVGRTLKTATAVLRVLRRMEVSEQGLSTEDVAELTGKSPATATYLLNSLVAEGFASQQRGRRYGLADPRVLQPRRPISCATEGLAAAAEELSDRTGERSYIGVPEGDSLVIRGTWGRRGQPLVPGLDPKVGGTAHALAVGKAMLAHVGPEGVQTYVDRYGLSGFTPLTITKQNRLTGELRDVVGRGFAYDDQEFTEGFACLSAPIFDVDGSIRGAVAISIRHEKFIHEGAHLVPVLTQIAERASGKVSLAVDQATAT